MPFTFSTVHTPTLLVEIRNNWFSKSFEIAEIIEIKDPKLQNTKRFDCYHCFKKERVHFFIIQTHK